MLVPVALVLEKDWRQARVRHILAVGRLLAYTLCANVLITARLLGCGLEHLCGLHPRRRQTEERQRVRTGREEEWCDPRAAQKEALSFSITAVATTTVWCCV